MHAFLSNLANRQTDKRTRANAFTSSFVAVGGTAVNKAQIDDHAVVHTAVTTWFNGCTCDKYGRQA